MSGYTPTAKKPRCRDYDEKGFCLSGDLCKFDHGTGIVEDRMTRFMLMLLQMLWCWRTQPRLLVTSQEDLQSPTYLVCPSQGSPFLLPSCQFLHQVITSLEEKDPLMGDLSHQPKGLTIPGWREGGEEEEVG